MHIIIISQTVRGTQQRSSFSNPCKTVQISQNFSKFKADYFPSKTKIRFLKAQEVCLFADERKEEVI